MPNGRGKNKAKHHRRAHKVSQGINGASKHPLTAVQKALLGKGAIQALEPTPMPTAWRGARDVNYPLFDKEQAEENREKYPHLFEPLQKKEMMQHDTGNNRPRSGEL